MSSFRSTKQKITIGYTLLLAMLLFSLVFVYHEMENLSTADDMQNLKTDSLLLLLREKDENTIQMLRILSEANDSLLSASEIEEIISEQDSLLTKQRIQNRITTKRDSLITKPKKKGFFKRLGEAFVPPKKESAVLVNTSQEYATDTIIEPNSSKDSLQQKIRQASRQKDLQRKRVIRRSSTSYQRLNDKLTNRVDSLIKDYEDEMAQRTREEAELQRSVRMRSARIIGGIAAGAVLLSVFFLVLILRDISRSNRYRKQLEEANKRAEDLLSAREKLMLAITHDFKAPLGSIMGYTELLSRLTEDERQRFYLDNMKGSSGHLLKLVNDLLDFHRLDLNKAEVNKVPFTPSQLFEEIVVSFQPLVVAKGLTLKCQISPELSGQYTSDPLRIHQIVNNLLSNAVKFTQKGGITLSATYATSRLILKIADTGKGMAKEDKDRIFQEFTRLAGAQGEEGFGLGLSIVYKLVKLLGGNIEVESTLGEGSCFTVLLPLYPVTGGERDKQIAKDNEFAKDKEISADKENKETKTTQEVARNKEDESNREIDGQKNPKQEEGLSFNTPQSLRILLIDDDKIQLDLTSAMLKQQGMIAVCCHQLEELTELLRTATFDILLTDIQMPAINGFDLVKLLRASNIPQARTIPVIAVTARSEMNEESLREHGFAGCLHKPFTVKELLLAIDKQWPKGGAIGIKKESYIPKAMQHDLPHLCCNIAPQEPSYHFSALTVFSEDDAEASRAILRSFIEETGKNADRMQLALDNCDTDGIAGIAHKLLPLFTMIHVQEAIPFLSWLESQRGTDFSEETEQVTVKTLTIIRNVVKAAEDSPLAS